MNNELTEKLIGIANFFSRQGMTLYYVGGTVRDQIMGSVVEDVDMCIVGAKAPSVVTILLNMLQLEKKICKLVSHVGQSFPIWIAEVAGYKVDFAMARTEKLIGSYRTDFICEVSNVTIEEDLRRRDLTINAIAKNVVTGELIDPYDGIDHIRWKLCHPVSEAFKEDSLRVIRGARFCARFNLIPSWTFYDYAHELKPGDISPERVGMELKKVMEQADKPSIFFRVLKNCGWLKYHFKQLDDLVGVRQDPSHHPEGDAYIHTLLSIDEAKDPMIRVVMLCHDLGKVTSTKWNAEKGRWQSIGHEEESVLLTKEMLYNIKFDSHKTVGRIATLVLLHMARIHVSEKTIRKNLRILINKELTYDQLVEVCRCDVSSRPPLPKYTPDIGQERAKEIVAAGLMIPVVTGEKLIKIGIESGKFMGFLVKKALELQDRGTLNEDNWKSILNNFKQKDYEDGIINERTN